ncbi:hypothetical protein GCM10022393_33830 [Aquimarina addita]|uniref:Repeat protein (TIGR03806 family) n=2 Tax=Aquimarina addita TaxID=870485 RepID=A0ABP6UTR6_9FLAO
MLFRNKSKYTSIEETIVFNEKLSDYNFFKGTPSDLKPTSALDIYELSSELFTDYADKQRMILLPKGKKIIATNSELPDFPNGTIIVKTFFYKNHMNHQDVKQKIIETRLLIKNNSVWNAATYRWNMQQDEAFLSKNRESVPITFIDNFGNKRSTSYQIPSSTDCATCHKQNGSLSPLGPKIRNLNIDILRNKHFINQLEYFKNQNKLEISEKNILTTPDYSDVNLDYNKRARAYFDINCAHCHNSEGNAYHVQMDLRLNIPFDNSGIAKKSAQILSRINISGELHMPKIGTTLNHDDGIQLITKYINSLNK